MSSYKWDYSKSTWSNNAARIQHECSKAAKAGTPGLEHHPDYQPRTTKDEPIP